MGGTVGCGRIDTQSETPVRAPFISADRVVAMVALVIAGLGSLATLATVGLSQVSLWGGPPEYFQKSVGRPLLAAAVSAAVAVLAGIVLIVLATAAESRRPLAWISAV